MHCGARRRRPGHGEPGRWSRACRPAWRARAPGIGLGKTRAAINPTQQRHNINNIRAFRCNPTATLADDAAHVQNNTPSSSSSSNTDKPSPPPRPHSKARHVNQRQHTGTVYLPGPCTCSPEGVGSRLRSQCGLRPQDATASGPDTAAATPAQGLLPGPHTANGVVTPGRRQAGGTK